MYRHGDTPKHFGELDWGARLRPATLSEDPIQRKGIGSRSHGPPTEILFPVYGKTAGITHNADNSGAAGSVWNLLGFTGFLVVQTFYSLVYAKVSIKMRSLPGNEVSSGKQKSLPPGIGAVIIFPRLWNGSRLRFYP